MKAITFQFQMLNAALWHPYTILYSIDIRVPKPLLWHDTERNQIVYIAVLDSEKQGAMQTFFNENPTVATLRSPFTYFELDDALYSPGHIVQLQLGSNPTCVAMN